MAFWIAEAMTLYTWVCSLPVIATCLSSLPAWVRYLPGFAICLGSLSVWVRCLHETRCWLHEMLVARDIANEATAIR